MLKQKWHQPAGLLSGGQKQMLAIGRAMVEERRLLLVDEPTKGLAPAVIGHLIEAFQELKRNRTTILLVEQNFHMARSVGDEAAVMDDGRIVYTGAMAALAADEACSRRLLGFTLAGAPVSGVDAAQRARGLAALPAWCRRWPLAMLPAMSFADWITLTVAGAAMGMMLFLMAAGLTLIFGLMDVLNFAHGAFITIGAYLAVSVLGALSGLVAADSLVLNLAALAAAALAAAVAAGLVGWAFEFVLVRRVYGSHLRQILITTGGLIVIGQLVVALWGPQPLARRQAAAAARQPRLRRRGGGALPAGRGGDRAGWSTRAWNWCSTAPASAWWCAPASRTGKWWRRWATASAGCSCWCSSPAPRWPASAA